MTDLTHIDANGHANMVDVGGKDTTTRTATARGYVHLSDTALEALQSAAMKKGDPLSVAQLAGIMAAKRTADLIPLCHPLALNKVEVGCTPEPGDKRICVTATVRVDGKTGVEMEALTAVSLACLTLYDMLKAVDKALTIGPIELVEKTGGMSGDFRR